MNFINKLFVKNNVEVNELNLRIKTPDQLFNSLDPSPFIEKDLDNDAIEYLVSFFEEFSIHEKIKILIHLPKSKNKKSYEKIIRKAIFNYFNYQKELEAHKIKTKMRSSQISLTMGSLILMSCIALKYLITPFLLNHNWTYVLISEGLTIGGWVAMWKPMGDILYSWIPMKREKEIYKKISESEIEFIYE